MSINIEICHVLRLDTDVGSGIYRALDRIAVWGISGRVSGYLAGG